MTLEEYVLTYKDLDGNIVVSVADYYERYVKPLDSRYGNWSFSSGKLVLCCFHGDINPSMGIIGHKYHKGVQVYHCFGCGASGNVIRMHQRIQKQYYGRTLTDDESALELCQLYGIDATKYKSISKDTDQSNFMRRMLRSQELENVYTLKEFSTDLREARAVSSIEERANKINSAIVKYTATTKHLFDY